METAMATTHSKQSDKQGSAHQRGKKGTESEARRKEARHNAGGGGTDKKPNTQKG